LHWDKRPRHEPAIVSYSEVAGPLKELEWSWQAHGARSCKRGPTVDPAWRVALKNYTELDQPITREMLNQCRAEVVAALEEVDLHARGTIDAPFQNYGGRELRAVQGYRTKFPAALVGLLFDASRVQTKPPDAADTMRR
jgi:hypothetical protein